MPDITIQRFRGGLCAVWREGGRRRRYQLKARTRTAAEAEALEVYYRNRPKPARSTIADILDAYRESLGDRPSGITLGFIMPKLRDYFGELTAEQVERDHCKGYEEARRGEGRSTGTVHTELGFLRSALVYAERAKLIDSAPHIWRPTKPERDMRILDAGEARALIEACEAPHVRLATVLLLGTAARVGAVLELEWSRVDFERGNINLRVPSSETRKGRAIVPMNGMTRAALTAAQEAALSEYVVEYAAGPVKSIRTGFNAAVRRSGIGHVRIHDLRHTSAVTMLAAGHPIELVAQVLGHSNVAMTYRVYGRYMPEHMAPAVEALDFTSGRFKAV